ncbi:YecA family protein [Intestinibacter bartlettii]|uniref:YecA family protein n=1 Tax=Intestinibacter bartlettii TaxID=261299 RepID=UPI00351FA380
MVGRNELCPCGSGRKYKKCCLEKDKAKDIARNRIKLGEKQFDNVITKISESTSEDYKAYKNKCEVDFGVSSYELENLMNVYYLVNYKYNKQSSLMMNYFNKHKQNINDADAEIIENTLNSYMSVYQVKEKDINKVLLRDIVLNEDVYVEDIDLFSEFKAGDFLLARIIPVGNTKIFVDKVVKINESRKTQIKNDIDNRFKQTKKKCKTKKQCLINNIKFMYQNLIEVRREYIVDTSCDVVEENIEEVLQEYCGGK